MRRLHGSVHLSAKLRVCRHRMHPLAGESDTDKILLWHDSRKNDRVDARRIAEYAMRFADRLRVSKHPTEELERLKQLEAERTLYLTDITKYKTQLSDQREYMPEGVYKRKAMRMKVLIASLEQSIKAIEEELDEVIGGSEELSRQKELLKSIDGVGRVVALNMIITTEAFSRFDNARQFCCYAGLAPFSYTSGSS